MAAARLEAGHTVDDGRVADVGVESLGRVEAEDTVLVLLFRRTLAPPTPKPARDGVYVYCVPKAEKIYPPKTTTRTHKETNHTQPYPNLKQYDARF